MDSNKIKKGLGRGLSSLIGETKIETQKNRLSVSALIPNKYQPRKIFDEENLNELANQLENEEFYNQSSFENLMMSNPNLK